MTSAIPERKTYAANRKWADQFLEEICEILGGVLFKPAPLQEDTKNCTDLIILRAHDKRVAVRVRTLEFAERYPWEFTVRAKSKYGGVTEIHKLAASSVGYYFYGFADASIRHYMILDLAIWRQWMVLNYCADSLPDSQIKPMDLHYQPNGDDTGFIPFNALDFPEGLVVSSAVPPLWGEMQRRRQKDTEWNQ